MNVPKAKRKIASPLGDEHDPPLVIDTSDWNSGYVRKKGFTVSGQVWPINSKCYVTKRIYDQIQFGYCTKTDPTITNHTADAKTFRLFIRPGLVTKPPPLPFHPGDKVLFDVRGLKYPAIQIGAECEVGDIVWEKMSLYMCSNGAGIFPFYMTLSEVLMHVIRPTKPFEQVRFHSAFLPGNLFIVLAKGVQNINGAQNKPTPHSTASMTFLPYNQRIICGRTTLLLHKCVFFRTKVLNMDIFPQSVGHDTAVSLRVSLRVSFGNSRSGFTPRFCREIQSPKTKRSHRGRPARSATSSQTRWW